jgi:hypothetical protein
MRLKRKQKHNREVPPGDDWFDAGHSWDLGAEQQAPRSPKTKQQQGINPLGALLHSKSRSRQQQQDLTQPEGLTRVLTAKDFQSFDSADDSTMYRMRYVVSKDIPGSEFDRYGGPRLSRSWGDDESSVGPQWRDEEEPLQRSAGYEARDWFEDGDEYLEDEQDDNSWGLGSATSASIEMRRMPSLMDGDSGSEPSNYVPMEVLRRKQRRNGSRVRPPPAPRASTNKNRPWRDATPERQRKARAAGKPRAPSKAKEKRRLHRTHGNAANTGFVNAATAQVLTEVLSDNSISDNEVPTQGMKGLATSEPTLTKGALMQTEEVAPSNGKEGLQDQHKAEPIAVDKKATKKSTRDNRSVGAAAAVAAVAGISTAMARRRSRSLQRKRSLRTVSSACQAASQQNLVPDSSPDKTKIEQPNQEAKESARSEPSAKEEGEEATESPKQKSLEKKRILSFGFLRKLRKGHKKECTVDAEETSNFVAEQKMGEQSVQGVTDPTVKPDAAATKVGENTAADATFEQNVGPPTAAEPEESDFCGAINSCFGFNGYEVNGKNQDAKTTNFSTMPNDGLQLDAEMDIDKAASIARRRRRREPIPIKAISFHTEPMEHDALTINSSISISEVFKTLPNNQPEAGDYMNGSNLKKKRSFLGRMRSKTDKKHS